MSWGFQNKNTMSFTFQKSQFPKMSVVWKLSKLTGFLCLMLISMSGKKVGNYCCMQDNTVLLMLPTFSQTLKLGYIRENQSVLTTSRSLTVLENDSFER